MGFFFIQMIIGTINSNFTFYFPVFQISIFFYAIALRYYNLKLHSFYRYFSYSIVSLILYYTISLATISIFFICVTPITIFLAGFIKKKFSIFRNVSLLVLVLSYSIITVEIIHPNVFYYNNYKKVFTRNLNEQFYDKSLNKTTFHKDSIYVLEFWNTTCSVCIEKFPAFLLIKQKFAHHKNVKFHTVNVKQPHDKANIVNKLLRKKELINHNLFLQSDSIAKRLDVDGYPTFLIIKNGIIIYNGYPSLNNVVLFNNLENIVENEIE